MSKVDVESLKAMLLEPRYELSAQKLEKILTYYSLLIRENEKQNLTRLISPQDFLEGHFLDCFEAEKSGLVDLEAIDLGSGCGVPGVLMAILNPARKWILCESEVGKAKFLETAVVEIGLSLQVQVFYGRIETLLKERSTHSVVARAVGTAEKLLGWLDSSSTWNNLVLFKGPKWEEELKELGRSKFKRSAQGVQAYTYVVGVEKKQRILVKLKHVPRGTA